MSDHVEDQIRLGLRLVADEVQLPVPARRRSRPPRRLVLAFGLTVVVAGLLVAALGRSSSSAAPVFLPDAFNYAPYHPGGQRIQPRGPGPLPFSYPILQSISAASADDGWIIGTATGRNNRWSGIAWRWNGAAWRKVPLPKIPGVSELDSVAAVGDGEAWAVGSRGQHPLVEHWDGSRWQVVPLPDTGVSDLVSVSADSPDDVWAVGTRYRGEYSLSGTRPLLLHWNGVAWSTVPLPWDRPGNGDTTRVVATSPNDVWVVVSDMRIEHWDGTSWQVVPAPFGPRDPLTAFDATSADDAWAVGSYGRGLQLRHSRTLAAHWDGHSWQIAPTPDRNTDSWLDDIVAVAPGDVWAVGESEWTHYGRMSEDASSPIPLFERWDGRRWKVMPGSVPQLWFGPDVALAAAGDGSAWAFGRCLSDNVLMRWNGSAWAIAKHPKDQHWDPRFPPGFRRGGFQHCRVSKR